MSPLGNSGYSSVFTYNPNVLMRPYQHVTAKALIEPHHITSRVFHMILAF